MSKDFPEDEESDSAVSHKKLPIAGAEEAPEQPQTEVDTREKLRRSRLARKTTLDTLKKTTIRAINDHLTRRYSPEELERVLNDALAASPEPIPVTEENHAG